MGAHVLLPRTDADAWLTEWMTSGQAGLYPPSVRSSLFIRYFMRGCERIKLNLNTQFGHKLWICWPQSIYGLHNIKNPRNWIRINWSKGGAGGGGIDFPNANTRPPEIHTHMLHSFCPSFPWFVAVEEFPFSVRGGWVDIINKCRKSNNSVTSTGSSPSFSFIHSYNHTGHLYLSIDWPDLDRSMDIPILWWRTDMTSWLLVEPATRRHLVGEGGSQFDGTGSFPCLPGKVNNNRLVLLLSIGGGGGLYNSRHGNKSVT